MKGKKILATLLALSVVSSSALVGCGDKKDSGSGNSNVNTSQGNRPEMDDKQELTIVGGEPKTLDTTVMSNATDSEAVGPISEGLTRVVGQNNGPDKIEPGVAETWESNEDATEWTFHLRKDAKWQDGSPVTAQDFIFSLRRLIDPRTASEYSTFLNPFVKGAAEVTKMTGKSDEEIDAALKNFGVTAPDDYTVKFDLKAPVPFFLQLSYFHSLKPVQKAAIEKYGDSYGTEADKTVANGPFILTEWVHNGKMVYEKNPNYWDKDNVYLEKIVSLKSADKNSTMTALFNGEIDRANVTDPQWIQKLDSTGQFDVVSKPQYDSESLVFNPKSGPMKNKKIRQAFTVGFSRESYSKDLYNGLDIQGYEFVPEVVAIGDKSFQEMVGKPQYTKQLINDIKDPKALLIEGMKEEGLGDDPSKLKVSITMRGDGEFSKKQGEWFQNKWKETLGVNVEVILIQYQIMFENMKKGDYDIAVSGWVADYDDPVNFLEIFQSEEYGKYHSYIGWNNKEFDKLVNEANVETDSKKRADLLTKAEKILLYDDAITSPFQHHVTNTYQKKYIKNFNIPGLSATSMDYKGVYIQGR
ncbi:oligopeptide transport system substrate-binding protein [Clostridium collagenovorans DSM 3089]|uniref:Oligopeptide transport system substrate-binding protein n=1 Tax=Clostridium collagenovorans DSM 3089 TaxID=1121306 RepID=A0A1M5V8U5_9CLOT|nr:peptide ABC transporter substrate-binding protein [Clostridium collagenovorans]SHH71558.1 oligopeptide transport system substrate-binding protein [Clostridium collagenovorans DSM 3089]